MNYYTLYSSEMFQQQICLFDYIQAHVHDKIEKISRKEFLDEIFPHFFLRIK